MLEIICVISFVAVALVLSSIKFLKEYERLVIFRLGRLNGVRGPGPQVVWPFIETFRKIDVRETTLYIEVGSLRTADSGSLEANGTCSLQITDPGKCITLVDDFREATKNAAANAVKEILSKYKSDEIALTDVRLKKAVKTAIERNTTRWGIRITDFTFDVRRRDEVSAPEIRSFENPSMTVSESGSGTSLEQAVSTRALDSGASLAQAVPTQATDSAVSLVQAAPAADSVGHLHTHHSLLHSHAHEHGHSQYKFGAHHYEFGHKHAQAKAEDQDEDEVSNKNAHADGSQQQERA